MDTVDIVLSAIFFSGAFLVFLGSFFHLTRGLAAALLIWLNANPYEYAFMYKFMSRAAWRRNGIVDSLTVLVTLWCLVPIKWAIRRGGHEAEALNSLSSSLLLSFVVVSVLSLLEFVLHNKMRIHERMWRQNE